MGIETVGIRGAGLSGLSVARELLTMQPGVKITLFDTRPRLPHPARTFCYFRTRESMPRSLRAYSWNTVMFRGASFERSLDVSTSPYTMIRGDDFFSSMLGELEEQGVEFIWECASVDINAGEHSVRTNGSIRLFDAVIDAAFDPRSAQAMMWQSFGGMWVTTENAGFDPSTAILMDLCESSAEAPVSFLYVLPTSEHTALVEHTTFSPSPMGKEYHLDRCFAWLKSHQDGQIQCGATEYGRIPMGLQKKLSGESFSVGSSAGVVRPATGYAFLRTQEHARLVAKSILNRTYAPPRPYPNWLTLADRLFLRALLNAPLRGRYLMEQLLSRARGDTLIAFLSDNIRLSDALSVWLSVPKQSMIRSLLRI